MPTSYAGTEPLSSSCLPVLAPSSLVSTTTASIIQGCPPIMGNIGSAFSGGPTGQSHIPGRYFARPLSLTGLPLVLLCIPASIPGSPPPPDIVFVPASDNIYCARCNTIALHFYWNHKLITLCLVTQPNTTRSTLRKSPDLGSISGMPTKIADRYFLYSPSTVHVQWLWQSGCSG